MPTANIPPGADGRSDRLSRARVSCSRRSASVAQEELRCLTDPFEGLTAASWHVGMVLLGKPAVGCSHRRVVCTT